MNDQQQRAAAIALMCEAFGQKATTTRLAAYELALCDISPADVSKAVQRWLRTSTAFVATPGQLRELCGDRSANDRAILAWGEVQKAVPIGSYRSVDFDDPIINATIRSMGGWPFLLSKTAEEFDKWGRMTFLKTYEGLCRAGVDGEACAPLQGLADSGTHDVKRINGTTTTIRLPGPVKVATGLPALPGVVRRPRIAVDVKGP